MTIKDLADKAFRVFMLVSMGYLIGSYMHQSHTTEALSLAADWQHQADECFSDMWSDRIDRLSGE